MHENTTKNIAEIISLMEKGLIKRIDSEININKTTYEITAYKVTDKLIRFDFKLK